MTRTDVQLGMTGGSVGTNFISAALSYPTIQIKKFSPKTPNGVLDLATSINQGGPQNLTAVASSAGVDMGVLGMVVVRTAQHSSAGVNQSMFITGINSLVIVPVSIGVKGTFTGNFIVLGIKHFITVDFFAWTPHTIAFPSSQLTSKGVNLPGVSAMGSFNLTANGGGTVTLVSPTKISIDCGLAQRRTAGFTSLQMFFVPEPGTLLLLGAGALGLVLVGTRKRYGIIGSDRVARKNPGCSRGAVVSKGTAAPSVCGLLSFSRGLLRSRPAVDTVRRSTSRVRGVHWSNDAT
jgi:hypothetical protein